MRHLVYIANFSAGTPIFRGYLAATDTRLDVVAESDDDRTEEEINNNRIPPRYGLPQWYISEESQAMNDLPAEYDHEVCESLIKAG